MPNPQMFHLPSALGHQPLPLAPVISPTRPCNAAGACDASYGEGVTKWPAEVRGSPILSFLLPTGPVVLNWLLLDPEGAGIPLEVSLG